VCGICGEFRLDDQLARIDSVKRMLPVLAARGPDNQGIYQEGPLVMGHRRLAIIDLSQQAHQPMVDAPLGIALVFNGTIYNYRSLRSELEAKSYRFFSSGDTEVIIKAYHCWGRACVERFEGMFAFALWDKRDRSLWLVRDRLGIKPLYYSQRGDCIRFASNSQALLAAGGVDTSIDAVSLHYQFSLHGVVPAPHTLLNGIRKCPPAHSMLIHDGRVRPPKAYWSLHDIAIDTSRDDRQWRESVHQALQDAVAKRLHAADVPVGVLLSGGLDSSLLVALLAELGVEDLRTFSVGFEDHPQEKGSEFEYSDLVVQRYQTRHQKIVIPNSEVLQTLPACVDAMAEPMVAQDAVAFYLLSEQVSREIKVVQSGQGADEVFGGYFWYPPLSGLPATDIGPFAQRYFDRDHEEFGAMIQDPYTGADVTHEFVSGEMGRYRHGDLLDRVLRFDATTLIVDDPVKRVDNMTMAWGLEARVPFLDHQLVELAAAIPSSLKIRHNGKYLLKEIARPLLPVQVIDRPKGYFPMPALKYVSGAFLEFMQDLLNSTACRDRGLFRPAYVQKLLRDPEQHLTRIRGSKLWHLALLEFWLQRHVDSVARAF